jgi:uncharacterized membrane protein
MYEEIIRLVAGFLALSGAAIVFFGGLAAIIRISEKELLKHQFNYNDIRRSFTSKVLMGLEFFIAGDLIKTVLEPSADQILILASIVAIRAVIGYSLSKELKDLGPDGSS